MFFYGSKVDRADSLVPSLKTSEATPPLNYMTPHLFNLNFSNYINNMNSSNTKPHYTGRSIMYSRIKKFITGKQ
jgi:hypothetical protein